MINVAEITDCYGCGVCAVSCPIKIIEIVLDKNGFYAPSIIDKNRCIGCGACVDVCSYLGVKMQRSDTNVLQGVLALSWAALF